LLHSSFCAGCLIALEHVFLFPCMSLSSRNTLCACFRCLLYPVVLAEVDSLRPGTRTVYLIGGSTHLDLPYVSYILVFKVYVLVPFSYGLCHCPSRVVVSNPPTLPLACFMACAPAGLAGVPYPLGLAPSPWFFFLFRWTLPFIDNSHGWVFELVFLHCAEIDGGPRLFTSTHLFWPDVFRRVLSPHAPNPGSLLYKC